MAPPGDLMNFVPAEDFFSTVPQFNNPSKVVSVQSSSSTDKSNPLRYAALITLQGAGGQQTYCLIQFVTPQVWRIRYNPKFTKLSDYPDENTRTIVQNSFAELVDDLQEEHRDSTAWNAYPAGPDWHWSTNFEQKQSDHWVLSSVDYADKVAEGKVVTSLHVFDEPFRLMATKILTPTSENASNRAALGLTPLESEQIVWQTAPDQAFAWQGHATISHINNVVMNVTKPAPAQYLGFGEQGGSSVLKKPTFMNYFCYDNFNYKKVYAQGALDVREPLYHSTPFYLEMNATPGYHNVTGLMIDNYSQVSLDFGRTRSGTISIGTRFNTFDAYVMVADDAPRLIWEYTSLVGRPKLKPRFILGHHQGCYGYMNTNDVETVVNSYRSNSIPLDGMHLDVDFQDRYRTFTHNGINFPDAKGMFSDLRSKGVKCCTNITPIMTMRESDTDKYQALRNFWNLNDKLNPATNLLVADLRYTEGLSDANNPSTIQATRYDGDPNVNPQVLYPDKLENRISYADWIGDPNVYRDDYVFFEPNPSKPQGNFNSGYPFHGGVSYGENIGTPGYYPDLNRADARQKWGEQYQDLFDSGLEFVWQDMTTPAAGNCYGDMLGFPSRLLMSDDGYNQTPGVKPALTKTAIELWSLYSYNLHKATYRGLQKLKGRENKRNFIIGRGSQTGMHRYAGLWTGDNGSSWNFWQISVAQVLALGYSGLTIAGVDMGGFTQDPSTTDPPPRWCDPELLVRWYTGAFLLPWYRNHYNRQFQTKAFQEPYNYANVSDQFPSIPPQQVTLYRSVMPICRYYVNLRYTLMQVLYDAMFANLIHGLPIARSMLITDPEDASLLNEGEAFVDNQYLLGYQILVCPILNPNITHRDIYLPQGDVWYPSNLRINVDGFSSDVLKHAANLGDPVGGGTITYNCPIPDANANPDQMAYVTPVYIRAGSIIPQLDIRQSIEANDCNPPCIHVYPGSVRKTEYSMYLDDGVSRDSAPADLPQYKYAHRHDGEGADGQEAQSKFREVKISQDYSHTAPFTRTISICHPWDNYDPTPNIGSTYTFGVWVAKSTAPTDSSKVSFAFQDQDGNTIPSTNGLSAYYDWSRGVLVTNVPWKLVPSLVTANGGDAKSRKSFNIKIAGLN